MWKTGEWVNTAGNTNTHSTDPLLKVIEEEKYKIREKVPQAYIIG